MVKGQRLAQTTTAVISAASRGRKSANKGGSATQNDIPKSKTTAMSVPSCSACGTVVTQDTRALQCVMCVLTMKLGNVPAVLTCPTNSMTNCYWAVN